MAIQPVPIDKELVFKNLAYAFGRIGQCIKSGGRRMYRLEAAERAVVVKEPDFIGRRYGVRGCFKDTVSAVRTGWNYKLQNKLRRQGKIKVKSESSC